MKQPNILFIMADHQLYYRHGWDFGPVIRRPNYHKLAQGGVEFTRAYSTNPLCGPTRRSILTGLYSHKHGEILNDMNVPHSPRSYLQILSDNGYRNYYFGKWHAGPGTAHDHGCEGYCYPSYGNPYLTPEYTAYLEKYLLPKPEIRIECTMDPWRLDIIPGRKYIQNKEWSNEQASGILLTPKETHEAFFLADQVCRQLEEIKYSGSDRPFSIRLDPWGPHDPYFVTKEFADLYNPEEIPQYPSFDTRLIDKPSCYRKEHNLGISDENQRLIYPNPIPWEKWQLLLSRCYAHITMVDEAMGRVLDKLEELGLAEDTLVFWTADHGDALACQGGKFDKASYMVEEVLRVPLAMRYPGKVGPGQITDALVSNIDVPVTIMDAAGLSFDRCPDGRSLLQLEASGFRNRRAFLVSETYGHLHRNVAKTILESRFKYTNNKEDIAELYDLARDPYEMVNLVSYPEHADRVAAFEEKLRKWVCEQRDNFFDGDSGYILNQYLSRGTNKPRDY